MADLRVSEEKTLKWEGGYCDVPGDTGGETIFGIARNANPNSGIWPILDEYKNELSPFDKSKYKELEDRCLSNETFRNEMDTLYREKYWNAIKGDEIQSQDVANSLYDFAVNSGPSRAVKYIQRVLNVADDGILGNGTLSVINSAEPKELNNKLCDARAEFFKVIAQKGQNAKFLKGWLRRVEDFYV